MIHSVTAQSLLKSVPKIDLHLHTNYTDGTSTISEYIDTATEMGLTAVLFSEHVDHSTDWFEGFCEDVSRQREYVQKCLDVRAGVEVRAADYEGTLNSSEHLLGLASTVMGVVHRYPGSRGGVIDPRDLSAKEALDCEFRAAWGLVTSAPIDILGHPGATYEKYFGEFPSELYAALIDESRERGIAVELNPAYQKNFRGFLKLCIERNALVTLGSNAHSAAETGRVVRIVSEALA